MDDLIAGERVPARISKKCLKSLGLLIELAATRGKWLAATITDQRSHPSVRAISKKTDWVGAIRGFAPLAIPGRA